MPSYKTICTYSCSGYKIISCAEVISVYSVLVSFVAKYNFWFNYDIFTAICKASKYVNMHSVPGFLHFQCLYSYAITWIEQVKSHQHGNEHYYPCSAESMRLPRVCKICNTETQWIRENQLCRSLRFCASLWDLHSDVSLHVQRQMIRTRKTPVTVAAFEGFCAGVFSEVPR